VLAAGSYTNAAEVTACGEPDANDTYGDGSGNDFASIATAPLPTVDLSLTKTVDQATPAVGTNVLFTITVSNAASFSDATGVVVSDVLPSGYAYVADDGAGSYVPATGAWSVGNVAAGGSRMLHITARVLGTGSYTNNAEVTAGGQPDANDTYGDGAGSDHATAMTTPGAMVDLSMTKTVDVATPSIGTNVVFTITLQNAAGFSDATGVLVGDLLPTGYAYVGDDGAGSYVPATGVWSAGNIAAGGSRVLHVTARVLVAGVRLNTAEVSAAGQPDVDDTFSNGAGEDYATASTNPRGNDGTVDITDTSVPGDTLALRVEDADLNLSPAAVDSIVVTVVNDMTGETEHVTLLETGPDTGIFTGTLPTVLGQTAGTFDDGTMATKIGDTVTVTYNDALTSQQATAARTDTDLVTGIAVRLVKTSDRDRAEVGTVVAYTLRVENITLSPLSDVTVEDMIPPGFKFVEDSARIVRAGIDGVLGTADDVILQAQTSGLRPMVFGPFSLAGPTQPGGPSEALLIRYLLRVGSGAVQGEHENTATPYLSNTPAGAVAGATVLVTAIPPSTSPRSWARSSKDPNRNNIQDPEEQGIAGAMVALDDGTYALTDEFGRYHIPVVTPGRASRQAQHAHRASRLGGDGRESRIVSLTPGLMARASFGVFIPHRTMTLEKSTDAGLGVNATTAGAPFAIAGSTDAWKLSVNGADVPILTGNLRMQMEQLDGVVGIHESSLETPVSFVFGVGAPEAISGWMLTIYDAKTTPVKTFRGDGAPPSAIPWDAMSEDGKIIAAGEVYAVQAWVEWKDGTRASSNTKLFGVNRRSLIGVHLAGDSFVTGKAELGPAAKETLDHAADLLRNAPDEKIRIEGHTDNVGGREYNLDLSRRRANAAMDYLVKMHGLPAKRFVSVGYGFDRPVASNDTPEGRAKNRRVEIDSNLPKLEEAPGGTALRFQPTVKINGAPLTTAPDGAFTGRVGAEAKSFALEMADTKGRSTATEVTLPVLEVLEPKGDITLTDAETGPCRKIVSSDGHDAARCTLRLRSEPGAAVKIDGVPAKGDGAGVFTADVTVAPGQNTFSVVATSAKGISRATGVTLDLSDHTADGRPRAPSGIVPGLTVDLPPEGAKVPPGKLTVSGRTDPGNVVTVNGVPAVVDEQGRYIGSVTLVPGKNALHVAARDPQGHEGAIDAELDAAKNQLFFMAFADGKFGQLSSSGNVEAAGEDAAKDTYTNGRVAYYLKGVIAGKYLITSAFDSGKTEYDSIFKGLDGNTARKLLTNLDPDKLYPVYGDDSTIVYDAESQGKFYLAVDSDEIHAIVGNFPLSLTDTELASYQRTLYGARFVYQSVGTTKYGDHDTLVALFGADVKNVHVRDELQATGGSLYYLSRRDVAEGSEEITIVVRDRNTGLPLMRQRQQQNFDYTIKYDEGRIMFHRPISSVAESGSLVDPTNLSGDPVFIEVDYEAVGFAENQQAYGGRARQQIGDHVAVGATYVNDELTGGSYELQGADTELRAGKNSRFVAEVATSSGVESIVNASSDGGITFVEKPAGGYKEGTAWKVGADMDVGEWFGRPDLYKVRLYFKDVDPGFFASGTTSDQGSRKSGASASIALTRADSVQVRYDRDERTGAAPLLPATIPQLVAGASDTVTSSVQYGHAANRWNLAVELLDAETKDAAGVSLRHTTLGAVRYWHRITDVLKASLEQQVTIEGPDNNQTTLGMQYTPLSNLALEARVTDGTLGTAGQIGATYNIGETSIYLTERLAEDGAGHLTNTVLGARSSIGPSTKLYSEYQWERADRGERQASLLGLQKQWDVTEGFQISVSGEAGRVVAKNADGDRYALAAGLTYNPSNRLSLVSRNEFRVEHGAKTLYQLFTSTQLDYKVNPDWTLQGKYRYSRTENRDTSLLEAQFEEGSVGVAYRPIANDRLNGMARLTHLADQRPAGLTPSQSEDTTMDVFSVEGLYQIHPKVEFFSKLAGRRQEQTFLFLQESVTSNTWLAIDRFNINLWKPLDLGVEWRLMAQHEANDRRQGFLAELMWRIQKYFRAGVGYNFTDFSDNEFSQNDYRTDGWFIRVQGRY
jgi:uncharacterized repeat protein (TIGR01451 family)